MRVRLRPAACGPRERGCGVEQPRQGVGRRLALYLAALAVALAVLGSVLAARAGAYVYWVNVDENAIVRAELNGTIVNPKFIEGVSGARGLAVDAGHIYWANTEANAIGRAKLDGEDVEQEFIKGASEPYAVAGNSTHIYWTNKGTGTIGRSNLEGEEVGQKLISSVPTLSLAVDSGHIYWGGPGTIGRANLEGEEVEPGFVSTLGYTYGLGVDEGILYWGLEAEPGEIGRLQLECQPVACLPEPDFINGGVQERGVEAAGGLVYWDHGDEIGRANLNGSEPEPEFTKGEGATYGLALDATEPKAPAPTFSIETLQEIEGSKAGYTGANLSAYSAQTVDYEILVKNTGNTGQAFTALSDAGCTGISPATTTKLAAGAEETFTCHHTLTSTGTYTTEASIEASRTGVKSSNKVEVAVSAARAPAFTIEALQEIEGAKAAYKATKLSTSAGETVKYKIVVKNTGNTEQAFTALSDPGCSGLSPEKGTKLAAGAEETFTCSHTLTSAGAYTNEASTEGSESGLKSSNKVEVAATVNPLPAFTIEELQRIEGGDAGYKATKLSAYSGQTVAYEIVVKNTGNTEQAFTALSDAGCSGISPATATKLAAVAEETFTCSHELASTGTYTDEAGIEGSESGLRSSNKVEIAAGVKPEEGAGGEPNPKASEGQVKEALWATEVNANMETQQAKCTSEGCEAPSNAFLQASLAENLKLIENQVVDEAEQLKQGGFTASEAYEVTGIVEKLKQDLVSEEESLLPAANNLGGDVEDAQAIQTALAAIISGEGHHTPAAAGILKAMKMVAASLLEAESHSLLGTFDPDALDGAPLNRDAYPTLTATYNDLQENANFHGPVQEIYGQIPSVNETTASLERELGNADLTTTANELEHGELTPNDLEAHLNSGLSDINFASGKIGQTYVEQVKHDQKHETQSHGEITSVTNQLESEEHDVDADATAAGAETQIEGEAEGLTGQDEKKTFLVVHGTAEIPGNLVDVETEELVSETSAKLLTEDLAKDTAKIAEKAALTAVKFADPVTAILGAVELLSSIFSMIFGGGGESNAAVLEQLHQVEEMIENLANQVTAGFEGVNDHLEELALQLQEDTQLLTALGTHTDYLANDLAGLQEKVNALQANAFEIAATQREEGLVATLDSNIGYSVRSPENQPMPLNQFEQAAGTFYAWGTFDPFDAISEQPSRGWASEPSQLYEQLGTAESTTSLDFNLDYLFHNLDSAQSPGGGNWRDEPEQSNTFSTQAPNPAVWADGANAFAQLVSENAEYATQPLLADFTRLDGVGATLPRELEQLSEPGTQYQELTQSGVSVNTGSSVYNHALVNYLEQGTRFLQSLQGQQNTLLAAKDPGKGDPDGSCSSCALAKAPTSLSEQGEAYINPWREEDQPHPAENGASPKLTPLEPVTTGSGKEEQGKGTKFGYINACNPKSPYEETAIPESEGGPAPAVAVDPTGISYLQQPTLVEEEEDNEFGRSIPETSPADVAQAKKLEERLHESGRFENPVADPLPNAFANAWHLGLGYLTACYASAYSQPNISRRYDLNYLWHSSRSGKTTKVLEVELRTPPDRVNGDVGFAVFKEYVTGSCGGTKNLDERFALLWTKQQLSSKETTAQDTCIDAEELRSDWGDEYNDGGGEIEAGTAPGIVANALLDYFEADFAIAIGERENQAATGAGQLWGSDAAFEELGHEGECQPVLGNNVLGAGESSSHRLLDGNRFQFKPQGNELHGEFNPWELCVTTADAPLAEETTEEVEESLVALRGELDQSVASPEEPNLSAAGQNPRKAAAGLDGARSLLDDYVQLGMPASVSKDPQLAEFIFGPKTLVGNTPDEYQIWSYLEHNLPEVEQEAERKAFTEEEEAVNGLNAALSEAADGAAGSASRAALCKGAQPCHSAVVEKTIQPAESTIDYLLEGYYCFLRAAKGTPCSVAEEESWYNVLSAISVLEAAYARAHAARLEPSVNPAGPGGALEEMITQRAQAFSSEIQKDLSQTTPKEQIAYGDPIFAATQARLTLSKFAFSAEDKPVVTRQPASVSVVEPSAATFTAEASGAPAPTVVWEVSDAEYNTEGHPIFHIDTADSGVGTDTLTVALTTALENGYKYRARFENEAGPEYSAVATLHVTRREAPTITYTSGNSTVREPEEATFTAEASGEPAPTVQWEVSTNGGTSFSDDTADAGSTTNRLSITSTTVSESGYEYRAKFENDAGEEATSEPPMKLTVEKKRPPTAELAIVAEQEVVGAGTGLTRGEVTVKLTQTLDYKITVSNTGTVTLEQLHFSDPNCKGISGGPTAGTLAAGASTAYTCEESVTHAGTYVDQASVEGQPPQGASGSGKEASNVLIAVGPSPSPTVTTGKGKEIEVSQTTAVLKGAVNPHGGKVSACTFAYGTTAALTLHAPCSALPGEVNGNVAVSATVKGLTPGASYHFAISAASASGGETGGQESFTTLPLAAPEVSTKPAVGLGQRGALLEARVDDEGGVLTSCKFEYSEAPVAGPAQFSAPCATVPGLEDIEVPVSAEVTGLRPGTSYEFRISASEDGKTAEGSYESFTTEPATAPSFEPEGVTESTLTTAVLNAAINPHYAEITICDFEYGSRFGDLSQHVPCSKLPEGKAAVSVSAPLSKLTCGTTYYFRAAVVAYSTRTEGAEEHFTTTPCPPVAKTEAASSITPSTAALKGTVNPEDGEVTSCKFEYGTSSSYTAAVPCTPETLGTGKTEVSVGASLTKLSEDTEYHFRVVAATAGGKSYGKDATFKTPVTPMPKVIGTIPVGEAPLGVSSDGTHVWVANSRSGTVSEIKIASGAVIATVKGLGDPVGVSSYGGHVWVANNSSGTVSEINASNATIEHTISVGSGPYGVSSDGTHVWVSNASSGTVSEINAVGSPAVLKTITGFSLPGGVSADGTDVWVANSGSGTVSEINASTGTVVSTIHVGLGPLGVSSKGGHVWVTNHTVDTLSEINASSGTLEDTIDAGETEETIDGFMEPFGVSSDGTHVWVTNAGSNTVWMINASARTVERAIKVGEYPDGVSSDGTHVWVANGSSNTVSEVSIPAGA